MISNRIEKKLKTLCHKKPIQIVLADWLLNGSVEDKIDVDKVLDNIDDVLSFLNGINIQINPKFNKESFYDELYRYLDNILLDREKFGLLDTRNRKIIEIRGWILPIYAKVCTAKNYEKCLQNLELFLDTQCERKVTQFWTLISIIYKFKGISSDKIDQFVNKTNADFNNHKKRDRVYWLAVLNNINKDTESTNYIKTITDLLETHESKRTNEINTEISELFVAMSYEPCILLIQPIQKVIDEIIEKDLVEFWEEKDLHLYKYCIYCLSQYGNKRYKKHIADIQVNIYYKLFKLLTISRNYSSRIWTEIKLQIIKALRIYNRTTGKKIIDELRDELLNSDMSIVIETCKTLISAFGIETTLKVIVGVLYDEQLNNELFSETKIYAISYALKLMSVKDNQIVTTLDNIGQSIEDHAKKNIVRMLFTEMGGMKAIKLSQQNNDIREKYMALTGDAQKKVENMFEKSILDAKKAFRISLYMNIAVFSLGILLLSVSGFIAILSNTQDNWVGVGVSSGTGFLSVIYSLFINKPSRKIRKNTNHLMRLKVIFLGYLRELTQMDQTFSKNLIDNEIITQEILGNYVAKIKSSMANSLEALRWEETLNNSNFTLPSICPRPNRRFSLTGCKKSEKPGTSSTPATSGS